MLLRPKHLPLTALRTFEVAARRLSFKDAAEELCVSATTVSNQIRQLEQDWDCKLFIRKTRAVVLTDEGRSLSNVLTSAFGDIRTEIESRNQTSQRTVNLAVGPIFGSRWLVPRLAEFRRDLPNINLVLRDSPRITDVTMMESHLAIDWGKGNWSGLVSHPLFEITYSPILSPLLLNEYGTLNTPSDLTRFPILHQRDRSEWTSWLEQTQHSDLTFKDEITITDTNTVMHAAVEAAGVALGIFPFMQPEIENGRLIKPFELALKPERCFHLLTKPNSTQTPEVASVITWILEQAANT